MDAPTVTGGVMKLLRDPDVYVVMDVGGDYIGARSIGGYAPLLNAPSTVVYYIINSYRAWSMDIDHIDQVLGQVLGVSHIRLENIRLIANCNLGIHTSAEDVNRGTEKVQQTVGAYKEIAFRCVWEQLHQSRLFVRVAPDDSVVDFCSFYGRKRSRDDLGQP